MKKKLRKQIVNDLNVAVLTLESVRNKTFSKRKKATMNDALVIIKSLTEQIGKVR